MAFPMHPGTQACCHRGRVRAPAAAAAAAAPVPSTSQHQQQLCSIHLQHAIHHVWGCPPTRKNLGRSSAPSVCRVVTPEQPAPAAAAEPTGAATLSMTQSLGSIDESSQATCLPEDFELAPGVLSTVDRTAPPAPEDAYRCPGCTKAECQVGLQGRGPSRHKQPMQQAVAKPCAVDIAWRCLSRVCTLLFAFGFYSSSTSNCDINQMHCPMTAAVHTTNGLAVSMTAACRRAVPLA